ncbi:hypothetical protein [Spirosoma lacussanchae]|uniref:hypothetical protein n=1 Tax=Spirosoma lacussanchae TaxID=1884249 RepID=UPI001109DCE4|nr:hypothetical protein [Spirosoma lacussanchae]
MPDDPFVGQAMKTDLAHEQINGGRKLSAVTFPGRPLAVIKLLLFESTFARLRGSPDGYGFATQRDAK